MDFQDVFQKVARFTYKNRLIVIMSALTMTVVFALALINVRLESDPQNLWVSHDSEGYQQLSNFNDQYGAFFRTQQIILAQNNNQQKNIFTHDHLYTMYFLLNIINKKSTLLNNKNISIADLCFRPIQGKGCYRPSPLDIWKMNITDLHEDKEIQYTSMCIKSRSQTSRIPCSDENQIPILPQSIFGGKTCDQSKDNSSGMVIPCQHCWIESKAMLATYLLNNDKYSKDSASAWQKDVLIDTIHKFNADDGSFIKEYRKHFNVSQDGQVLDFNFPLNLNNYTSGKMGVHFQYLSERSIPDELINQTNENMFIVIISYGAMLIYISIAIGKLPSIVTSGVSLAITGILIVLASVLTSMGIITYLDIGFTMISAQVIPFLILAIGVDNMFIIKNALQREKGHLQDRIAAALKQVGPSITTAAICQSLAFLVGSFTKMPALQSFCLQAAIAIFFNYIYQLTAFIAILIIDEQRKIGSRVDLLCCFTKSNHSQQQSQGFWSKIFEKQLSTLLMNKICMATTIVFSLALLACAILGIIFLKVGLNEQVSMQVDSDLFDYFTYQKKYIQIGPPAYIVFNNFDFTDEKIVNATETLNNQLSKLQYIQPPVFSWFASFNNFKQSDTTWAIDCGTTHIDEYTYEQQLKLFLAVSIDSQCCQTYGICGEQYNKDLIFNEQGKLVSSRLRVMHKPLRNSYDYIRAARQTRMAVNFVMNQFKNQNRDVYPYSLFYVYYDQYGFIRSVAIQNLLLALAVVYFTVSLIQSIKISLVICGMVLLTTLDLIGIVWVTNTLFPDHGFVTQINAVSVVNIITCVGLAVEFTAHVCISMFKSEGSQQQKLRKTMKNTGSSVFVGIGLTKFVGVLVLALANSTLFRLYYFRMYLGIVLLGLFNGLIVLPIALYLFGPRNKQKNDSLLKSKEVDQF